MFWKLNLLKLSVPVAAAVVIADLAVLPFLLDDAVTFVLGQLFYLIEVIPVRKIKLKSFLTFHWKEIFPICI